MEAEKTPALGQVLKLGSDEFRKVHDGMDLGNVVSATLFAGSNGNGLPVGKFFDRPFWIKFDNRAGK